MCSGNWRSCSSSPGVNEEAVASLERIRAVDPDFSNVEQKFNESADVRRQAGGGATGVGDEKSAARRATWMAHAYVMAGRRVEVERLAATNEQSRTAWRSSMPPLGTTTARSRRWTGRLSANRSVLGCL